MRAIRTSIVLLLSVWAVGGAAAQTDRIAVGAPPQSGRLVLLRDLGELIRSFLDPEGAALPAVLAAAAAYGVLHSLGPGHQKTLIAGYLFSEGGSIGSAAAAASISAATHAASVIVLFGGLALLQGGLSVADVELARVIVTRLSALILIALALRMLYIRVRAAVRRFRGAPAAVEGACGHGAQHAEQDAVCEDCGGSPEGVAVLGTDGRTSINVILAGSLTPCPGAAFFLLYGFSAANPLGGVLAVLAISAGMWVTLFAVGCAAVSARRTGLNTAEQGGGSKRPILRTILEIGGASLVLAFAVTLVL